MDAEIQRRLDRLEGFVLALGILLHQSNQEVPFEVTQAFRELELEVAARQEEEETPGAGLTM